MSKYLSLLVAFAVTLFAATSFAFTAPPAPAKGWYVTDQTGRMTTTEVSSLNQKIKRISDATHNEFGLALIQSLDGATIEDAAYETFRKWGIGKHGLDNGVLIILSLKDHKSRIETGKGVGGEITDLQSKQILDSMRPQLRDGKFYGAFNLALDSVSSLLDSRANQKATPLPAPTYHMAPVTAPAVATQAHESSGHGFLWFLFFLMGAGIVGIVVWRVVAANAKKAEALREEQEHLDNMRRAVAEANRTSVPIPTTRHTIHHATGYARPSTPLTPATPVMIDHTSDVAVTALATTALLESERESREERRRQEAREERREAEARQERRAEEERAATRREEESRSSYVVVSTPDSGSSSSSGWDSGSSGSDSGSSGSDSGGGFGGGDSGGGGSSSDW